MNQIQIDILSLKLLAEDVRFTSGIARHVRSLLHIRQGNQLDIWTGFKDRLKALQCSVDCAAQRRGRDQFDVGVVGKDFT